MANVTMFVTDLEHAALDNVWYPVCPNCGNETPAEPDAQCVYCVNCDAGIEIDNPYL